MEEIWKDIKFTDTDGKEYDYTDLYQVSNLGRVRSLDRTVIRLNNGTLCEVKYNGKVLKQGYCEGYFHVVLCKNGARKQMHVHRLVAHMFIENNNMKEFIIVNHKDENPSNNTWTNLEWCTPQYNVTYGTAIKRSSEKRKGRKSTNVGELNGSARKVCCLETMKIYETMKQAEEDTGVSSVNICNCCRGKQKTAGKLHWEYVVD